MAKQATKTKRSIQPKLEAQPPQPVQRLGPQITFIVTQDYQTSTDDGLLSKRLPATYETYRKISRQPTVAFVAACSMAPALAASWSTGAEDDVPPEVPEFLASTLLPKRQRWLEQILRSQMRYGWSAHEQLIDAVDTPGGPRLALVGLKHLLPDLTDVMLDVESGRFAGFRQTRRDTGEIIGLERRESFHSAIGVEGDNLYGTALLESCRLPYGAWVETEAAAERYDKKVAGANALLLYPEGGKTFFNGSEMTNEAIAQILIERLAASSPVAMPRKNVTDQFEQQAQWELTHASDMRGAAGDFATRLKYLDSLLARALIMPERAVFEGQFGTKAESVAQSDWALLFRDLWHRAIVQDVNEQIVDQLLVYNWGPDMAGRAWVVPNPIIDAEQEFFRRVYEGLLVNPLSFDAMVEGIDTDALTDAVKIPKLKRDISAEGDPEPGDVGGRIAQLVGRLYAKANPGGNGNGSTGGV